MVNQSESYQLTVSEAQRLRQQAVELLDRLTADREQSERRHAETGKRDPMKFITGRTALDNAIASVREMIANMDALHGVLECDPPQPDLMVQTTIRSAASRSQPRPATRPVKHGVLVAAHASHTVAELQ